MDREAGADDSDIVNALYGARVFIYVKGMEL
jgi:hypothetical protein